MATWLIDAEIVYQGQQASTNFEIEADSEEEALSLARKQLENDGAVTLSIDVTEVGKE